MKAKYTDKDLMNLICLCEQSYDTKLFDGLRKRAMNAFAFTYKGIRITERDKELLKPLYDPDMDEGAKNTLEKILK